jgi:osmotically-inducible protein OsmY
MKSDVDLREEVIAELGYERSNSASEITVDVNDGYVTLTGRVRDPSLREAAETAALRVAGTRGVNCEIGIVLADPNILTPT